MRLGVVWITGICALKVFDDSVTVVLRSSKIKAIHKTDIEVNSTKKGSAQQESTKQNKRTKESAVADSTQHSTNKQRQAKTAVKPEACIVIRTEGQVSSAMEERIQKECSTQGCTVLYVYKNIFDGITVCGNSTVAIENIARGVFGTQLSEIEHNGVYHLAYKQTELPDNFYTIMNSQKKTLNIDAIDSIVNRYIRNGYIMKKSVLMKWYRDAYMSLTTMSTGKGVTIFVIDGNTKEMHKEIEGRVRIVESKNEVADGHAVSVMTAAGGRLTGLAKDAEFVLYPVFKFGIGYLADIVYALDYIAGVAQSKKSVVLMAFAGDRSEIFDTAIRKMYERDIHVVAAAGNSAESACNYSPGASVHAVTVGGVSDTYEPEKWTNTGHCVNVYAPGSATVGTVESAENTKKYGVREGTSMSAAYTAGYIAQMIQNNAYSTEEIKNMLYTGKAYPMVQIPHEPSSYPVIRGAFAYSSPLYDTLIIVFCITLIIVPVIVIRKKKHEYVRYRRKR